MYRYIKIRMKGKTRPVVICADCGARGPKPEEVDHYPSCDPAKGRVMEEFFARDGYSPEALQLRRT